MGPTLLRVSAWILLAVLVSVPARPDPGVADLVLVNGKIFTSVAAQPYVQAVAIRGDRIVATGSSPSVESLAGPRTRRIDLGGRTVVPGINDAHQHIGVRPANTLEVSTDRPANAWSVLSQALGLTISRARSGDWVAAEIGPGVFHDPAARRIALDRIAPRNPVILMTFSGHGAILNSAALQALGIGEGQRDPVGGFYGRAPDGRLDGVAREYAIQELKRRRTAITSHADALRELRTFLADNARFGITSVQDMSSWILPDQIVELLKEAPTPLRVRVIRMPVTTPLGRDVNEGRSLSQHPSGLITVSGTKWFLDATPIEDNGSASSSGAPRSIWALKLTFPETEMVAMLQESLRNNDQLMVHVAGSTSAEAMVDAMEKTGGPAVWASRRVRFEHGDGILPALIPRVKALGIVVVQNPTHLDAHGALTPEQIGQSQPLRSLIDAGVPVAFGADGDTNPYLDVLLASTHPDHPSEAITREQAVIAYTLTSAYAEFAEAEKGTLEVGKLADLAVLSQAIFDVPADRLPKTESVMTIVGGKIVFDGRALKIQ